VAVFFETYLSLPTWLALTVAAVIHCVLLLHLFALSPLFFIWLERKVAGRIQDRLGPTRVGGQFGWLQTLADGIKLILKEDLTPTAADKPLFRMAPYIVFLGSFVAFVALPFAAGTTSGGTFSTWVAQELDVAVFFMLAVMSLEVFGIILAGYASGSKWSLFGGMREAAQMVSYEVPMAICVVIPVLVAGTMSLSVIGHMQQGWFWNWFLFHDPFTFLSFWVYFTCATASVKRAPFDLAEAESELVAGFHTEYSGLRWSFFFMAEYSSMFAVSGIAAILFLGGWNGPIPVTSYLGIDAMYAGRFIGMLNFMGKAFFLVFVMMWVRWTLPRLRIDQVMKTCLKYLLPMSCALLLCTAVWPLVFPSGVLHAVLGESAPVGRPLGEVYPLTTTAPPSVDVDEGQARGSSGKPRTAYAFREGAR
jgi:NADH-quinone oxidoreductase subunit H